MTRYGFRVDSRRFCSNGNPTTLSTLLWSLVIPDFVRDSCVRGVRNESCHENWKSCQDLEIITVEAPEWKEAMTSWNGTMENCVQGKESVFLVCSTPSPAYANKNPTQKAHHHEGHSCLTGCTQWSAQEDATIPENSQVEHETRWTLAQLRNFREPWWSIWKDGCRGSVGMEYDGIYGMGGRIDK